MNKFEKIVEEHEDYLQSKKAEMLLKKENYNHSAYSSGHWKGAFENLLKKHFDLVKRIEKLERDADFYPNLKHENTVNMKGEN